MRLCRPAPMVDSVMPMDTSVGSGQEILALSRRHGPGSRGAMNDALIPRKIVSSAFKLYEVRGRDVTNR